MTSEELAFSSVTTLAQRIRTREISPVDVVRTYLERIERFDGLLHSYITVCADRAIAEARAAEQAVIRGDQLGPLHGIPIAVKDQLMSEGVRTTNGLRALAEFVPNEDATALGRARRAGAILLGKLNMPESALLGTRDWPFGQPRNPWNTEYDAGASSTGSGIAAAAALCAAALGEDTGGSIRNPASWNGVVGLRPTWGRVSCHGVMPLVWNLDTVGPMTRTVADCALILGTIAGEDSNDQFAARVPVPDYVSQLTGDIRGMRVGVMRELAESDFIDAEVSETFKTAVAALEGLGAKIEDVSLPLLRLVGAAFFTIADSGAAVQNRRALESGHGNIDPGPRRRMLAASLLPTALYLKVEQFRNLLRDQVRGALERVDVLVGPTAPAPAARIAAARAITWTRDDLFRLYQRASHTSGFSLAAVPALSVPCGFTRGGLPIGMQLVGRPFGEATVFRAADAYERANPSRGRRPPLTGS